MMNISNHHCMFVPIIFSLLVNQDSLCPSEPQPHSDVGLPTRDMIHHREIVDADDSSDFSSDGEYDEDEASAYEENVDKAAQCLIEMNFEPALTLELKRIVQQTLDDLPYILPDTPPSSRSCAETQSSHESGQSEPFKDGLSPQRSRRHRANINNQDELQDGEDGEEDEDGGRRRKKPSKGITKSSDGRRFACPFSKNDPEKYQDVRSCAGFGWETIHRLK
jgi:hypothetical protein